MTAVHTVVRVFVVGPHDLVTTSVVAALQRHGFRAQEWGDGPPPIAPSTGGLAVVALPVRAGLVARAVRSGWRVVAVFTPGDDQRAAAAVAEGAAAILPRSAPLDELLEAVSGLVGRPVAGWRLGRAGRVEAQRQSSFKGERLSGP